MPIKYLKFFIGLACCWLAYCLPIEMFALLFRKPMPDTTGAYLLAVTWAYILGTISSVIYAYLTPKYYSKRSYYLAVALIYFLIYTLLCNELAYDHRMHFGTTWSRLEIFFSLVAPHWYYYTLGALGVTMHTLGIWLMRGSEKYH